MFTPQQIDQISFTKATFGGYDMQQVDEFLEPLTEDYVTLYKENALLKSKMKVLVSKLEEYRAKEASMKDSKSVPLLCAMAANCSNARSLSTSRTSKVPFSLRFSSVSKLRSSPSGFTSSPSTNCTQSFAFPKASSAKRRATSSRVSVPA